MDSMIAKRCVFPPLPAPLPAMVPTSFSGKGTAGTSGGGGGGSDARGCSGVSEGGVALKTLTNEISVEKLHGEVIEKNGQKFFVSFHPSAALRFPETRKKMEEDFRKLKALKI